MERTIADENRLEIDSTGGVVYEGRIVGEFDGERLTLNAGWCRLAGLAIKIEGDTTDRRRVLLERPEAVAPARTRKAPQEDAGQPTLDGGTAPEPDPVLAHEPPPEDPWAKPDAAEDLPVEDPPIEEPPVRGHVMAGMGNEPDPDEPDF